MRLKKYLCTNAKPDQQIAKSITFFFARASNTATRSRALILANSGICGMFSRCPRDLGGLRDCINSVALHLIPLDRMEADGYGEYFNKVEVR